MRSMAPVAFGRRSSSAHGPATASSLSNSSSGGGGGGASSSSANVPPPLQFGSSSGGAGPSSSMRTFSPGHAASSAATNTSHAGSTTTMTAATAGGGGGGATAPAQPPTPSSVTLGRSGDSSSDNTTSQHASPGFGTAMATFPSVAGTNAAPSGSVGSHYFAAMHAGQPGPGATDQQSMYNNAAPSFSSAMVGSSYSGGGGGGSSLADSDAAMRETFARRIRALGYVKRCLSTTTTSATSSQDRLPPSWLDTVRIPARDLEAFYDSEPMRKRAGRYYVLGCSLAPTIELTGAGDFARAVLAVLQEVEMGEGGEKDRTKMRNFFKSSVLRAAGGGGGGGGGGGSGGAKRVGLAEFASTIDGVGVGGPALSTMCSSGVELIGTHVPFAVDFLQTTIALCDILTEVYCKFNVFLTYAGGGGSVIGEGGGGGGGGGGGKDTIDSSLSSSGGLSSSFASVGDGQLSAATVECINKADGKIKKLLSQLVKELDSLARQLIRDELASVDPLMARDLAGSGGGGGGVGPTSTSHHHLLVPASSAAMTISNSSTGPSTNAMLATTPLNIHGNLYSGSAPNLLTEMAGAGH